MFYQVKGAGRIPGRAVRSSAVWRWRSHRTNARRVFRTRRIPADIPDQETATVFDMQIEQGACFLLFSKLRC